MRVNLLKIFALIFLLGAAGSAFSQTPYSVINMTNHTWKYNQSGANQGSAWRAANYNDTSWSSGFGVFSVLADSQPLVSSQTRTTLALTNANNQAVITFYFRTSFNLTNNPFSVNVVLTNLIDDGAVFYMNGTEFARQNMAAAPTPITYVSGASSSINTIDYTTLTVPQSLLLVGTNVLAVEVHNVNQTSKDVAFGLAASVVYPPPTQLVITNQPESFTTDEFTPATFTAGVSGNPINYIQWFRNGTPVPGGNSLTLTLTNATLADAGNYWVTVSNGVGAVTSDKTSFLYIIADTNAPVILVADGTESATNVVLTFSERLLAVTATNASNYRVTNIGGANITVTRAVLSANGSNVTIYTSAPRVANTNYLVVVNGIRDSSPRTNLVALNHSHPISTSISLVDEFSWYYFYNPVEQYGQDPVPASTWKQVGFNPYVNDTAHPWWGDNETGNRGVFYFGGDDWPSPQGQQLQQTDVATVYFVQPMMYNASPLGATIMMQYLADDGAVFYMNGTEFYRANLPAGNLTYNTTASGRSSYPPAWLGPYVFKDVPVNIGLNSFAAELHTVSLIDTNFGFAARITADISSYALGPVVITRQPTNLTVFEGQSATFDFYGAGPSRFQWFQITPQNTTNAISGATNATYTIPVVTSGMNSNRYFVIASNSTSSARSSNAVLSVLSDIGAPSVVSAYTISSNQILVTFSERMGASAAVPGNYTVTNRIAPNLNILSAVITNGTNVLLTVVPGGAGQYILVAKTNITDAATTPNAMSATNAAYVGVKVSLPIDTDWKYNYLGQDLGTAWRAVSYPSENTWSNGLALIYDEGSALPAPKNTEIATTSPTTSAYVTTFYYRKTVPLATGASNVVVSVRHIIDDGVVMYINNAEFHRFNMAGGAVTAATYANVSVDNADWAGPFNTILNTITGGNNVIAAEVHQINGNSSDTVFGAEMTLNSSSVVIVDTNTPPPPPPPPRLVVNSKGTNATFSLSWTNTPGYTFTLQSTTNLVGNALSNSTWINISSGITTINNISTYNTAKTNRANFYRVRRTP